jgi:glucosamine--fructose-6-phosphate aminotransferase (isomerizing)
MCGIFGIVTRQDQLLGPVLVEAGRKLTYRGYDSVGCATLHKDGGIDLRKDVGKVDDVAGRLDFNHMTGSRGIIQLRWATFGSPSKINAQPHLDSDGDLVGAHNGNVVNNVELRQQFIYEGMTVRSNNDGETCVHAVEHYVHRGYDLVDATRLAYQDLAGDYTFIIGRNGEDRLCAIKKGVSLVVGIAEDATCVSSDLPSILHITRRILRIGDGEMVILWPDRVEIRRVEDGSLVEREVETFTESMEDAQRGGYEHFMLKEIHEQPHVVGELIRLLDDLPHTLSMVERMSSARHLYLVGSGSSYNASVLGAFYLACLAERQAIPVQAPQFISHYLPILKPEDVVVLISQSGETKDVINAEKAARSKKAQTLALVNVIGSTLTRVTQRYLPLACGYEISASATKTFSNQVTAFLYMALQMGRLPTAGLANLPPLLEGCLEAVDPQVEAVKNLVNGWEEFYCLGYGSTYASALEGALKLKEITYVHCEGMLSTEFKHGSLTSVREGYPVLFIAGPEDIRVMVSSINEVTCRGGAAIVIGEENAALKANASHMLVLPKAGPLFNPLMAVLPMQLLAYRLSQACGYDPDYPRNISKTLTMD